MDLRQWIYLRREALIGTHSYRDMQFADAGSPERAKKFEQNGVGWVVAGVKAMSELQDKRKAAGEEPDYLMNCFIHQFVAQADWRGAEWKALAAELPVRDPKDPFYGMHEHAHEAYLEPMDDLSDAMIENAIQFNHETEKPKKKRTKKAAKTEES